jgi:hypothetical protein
MCMTSLDVEQFLLWDVTNMLNLVVHILLFVVWSLVSIRLSVARNKLISHDVHKFE